MEAVIAVVILILLASALFAVARKTVAQDESKYDPNVRWADLITRAGELGVGKKSIFRLAWSLSGLKTQFASLKTPVVAIMAVSAWETGWGTSRAAMTHNNLSGISTNDVPRAYANIGEWFNAMSVLLMQPRYAVAMQKTDPSDFVRELGKAGYNSTGTWLAGVLSLVSELSVPEVA